MERRTHLVVKEREVGATGGNIISEPVEVDLRKSASAHSRSTHGTTTYLLEVVVVDVEKPVSQPPRFVGNPGMQMVNVGD